MSDKPHNCGHERVQCQRSGDTLRVTCTKCGESFDYPLEDDEPGWSMPAWLILVVVAAIFALILLSAGALP